VSRGPRGSVARFNRPAHYSVLLQRNSSIHRPASRCRGDPLALASSPYIPHCFSTVLLCLLPWLRCCRGSGLYPGSLGVSARGCGGWIGRRASGAVIGQSCSRFAAPKRVSNPSVKKQAKRNIGNTARLPVRGAKAVLVLGLEIAICESQSTLVQVTNVY
jgi:hypothetical protein